MTVSGDPPAVERPLGLGPEDFEEESAPADQSSSTDGNEVPAISDASSQDLEGPVGDWEEWEMASDIVDVAPVSGAVPFDGAPHIREVEVSSDSPMLKYGLSTENADTIHDSSVLATEGSGLMGNSPKLIGALSYDAPKGDVCSGPLDVARGTGH